LAVHRPGGSMSRAIEKTFRGQQLAIERAASLCGTACELHPADAVTCLRERRRYLYYQLGYERFWSGRLGAAADAYREALRLTRSGPRVLFEAASPMSLAVFRPVLERMQRDPRIDFWFTSSDAHWDPRRIFSPAGVDERVLRSSEARRMKFDAYVNTDFWNMTWLPRRTKRVHLF